MLGAKSAREPAKDGNHSVPQVISPPSPHNPFPPSPSLGTPAGLAACQQQTSAIKYWKPGEARTRPAMLVLYNLSEFTPRLTASPKVKKKEKKSTDGNDHMIVL